MNNIIQLFDEAPEKPSRMDLEHFIEMLESAQRGLEIEAESIARVSVWFPEQEALVKKIAEAIAQFSIIALQHPICAAKLELLTTPEDD